MMTKPTNNHASEYAIGTKVAVMRKTRGMTQQQLADAVGVSRRAIASYETDASKVTAEILAKIAQALAVSADELLALAIEKEDGRTVEGRFWRKWHGLPPEDKKAVSRVVDALLTRQKA